MIELKVEFRGYQNLLDTNKAFQRRLPGVVLNAIRRPLRRRVTTIRRAIKQGSGIGRSVWGPKGKGVGLTKIVRLLKAKVSQGALVTGVVLKGMPVLIEQGGQIKAHVIKRAWGRATANHPGARVRAHGYAKAVMANAGSEAIAAIRYDLDKLIAKLYAKAA